MNTSLQQQQAVASIQSSASARDSAIKALEQRGIINAPKLVDLSAPELVLGWCGWWDRQRGVRPALLVERIRSGEEPPRFPTATEATASPEEIEQWLVANMPDVCLNPETLGRAVQAVWKIQFRFGRGTVTRRAHGDLIRRMIGLREQLSLFDTSKGRES